MQKGVVVRNLKNGSLLCKKVHKFSKNACFFYLLKNILLFD